MALEAWEGEMVRCAIVLISNPENWTTGVLARDACGEPIQVESPGAVKWCAIGALVKCGADARTLGKIAEIRGNQRQSLSFVNDGIGRESVIDELEALLPKAT